MGKFSDLVKHLVKKKRKIKELQEDDRIQETLKERKLSYNERELMKLLENKRQKEIKDHLKLLDMERKWEEKQNSRNMLKFNPLLFQNQNILKEKSIF